MRPLLLENVFLKTWIFAEARKMKEYSSKILKKCWKHETNLVKRIFIENLINFLEKLDEIWRTLGTLRNILGNFA